MKLNRLKKNANLKRTIVESTNEASNKASNTDASKNLSHHRIILLLLIVVAFGVMFSTVSYSMYVQHNQAEKILAVNTVETSVIVVTTGAGMDGNREILKFGKVPLGGGGTRYLNVTSVQDAIVSVRVTGNISKFLTVDENNFYITANSSEQMAVNVDVPQDASIGSYFGTIEVIFLKPNVK